MMNQKEPLVSVLVPCYNVEQFVEKAVYSIINQTYKNIEIWVIDDGSTDHTLGKINAIKDDRIKVIAFKENTQKIGAVNEVLQKVNGDFIAFQDADDWSEPDRLQEQLKEFQKDPGVGICFTKFRNTGLNFSIPQKIALTNEELKDGFLNFSKSKNGFTLPMCASMMISKAALLLNPGYHPYFMGRVAEDIHWICRILKGFRGITIDKILYHCTIRKGSMTQVLCEGKNAKYSYSWQLLSKIIDKDIFENIDVLDAKNAEILQQIELEACEQALMENIQLLNATKEVYLNSMSFKIGKFILTPIRFLKSIKN